MLYSMIIKRLQMAKLGIAILIILSSLIPIKLSGQTTRSFKKSINVCEKICLIDSSEYYRNRQSFKNIDSTSSILKRNKEIIVKTKDSTYIFKDNITDEGMLEFTIKGQDLNNKWILMLGQDYNQDHFYLVNQNTNKIDTLIGYPRVFGNKYLCIEGPETDGTSFIEIWNLTNGILQLSSRFSLIPCGIYTTDESYLKNDYLYVNYEHTKYLKVKY